MSMTNKQKIGTYFKKENIFLATVNATEKNIQMGLDEKFKEALVKNGLNPLECEMSDIYYKDGEAYLRFIAESVETVAGDGSDGMGVLRNIVSVWDYYSEDELFEAQLEDGTMVIGFTTWEGVHRYIRERNRGLY